uniref:Uncharacterized protein n=1 Tax=Rhizophora mucronata TaxID=61149 RepID=A0A2P2IZB2_RHIMU
MLNSSQLLKDKYTKGSTQSFNDLKEVTLSMFHCLNAQTL